MRNNFRNTSILFLVLAVLTAGISGCKKRNQDAGLDSDKHTNKMMAFAKSIPDADRSMKVVQLIESLEQELMGFHNLVQKHASDSQALFRDYESEQEDFEKLLIGYNIKRKAFQKSILGTYQQLKEVTTAKEWKKLAKLEKKALLIQLQKTALDK